MFHQWGIGAWCRRCQPAVCCMRAGIGVSVSAWHALPLKQGALPLQWPMARPPGQPISCESGGSVRASPNVFADSSATAILAGESEFMLASSVHARISANGSTEALRTRRGESAARRSPGE